MSMEENKLTHNNMPPTWKNTRNPITSQNIIPHHPNSSSSISQLEASNGYNKLKLMKNYKTQACNSNNVNDMMEEEQEHNGKEKVEVEGSSEGVIEETGRERLKRHREEVMKEEVKIPENWGQEKLLKDWIDYTTFDALFAPHRVIVAARDALIADGRKSRSQRLRI